LPVTSPARTFTDVVCVFGDVSMTMPATVHAACILRSTLQRRANWELAVTGRQPLNQRREPIPRKADYSRYHVSMDILINHLHARKGTQVGNNEIRPNNKHGYALHKVSKTKNRSGRLFTYGSSNHWLARHTIRNDH